jgi:phosphatidylserine/phosphatidylglycerophosphate/cardiolipin synthase-like enzyme
LKQLTQPLPFYHREFTAGFDSRNASSAYFDPQFQMQLDRMFHNKIWIRDGEEAVLGGMNVLDCENDAGVRGSENYARWLGNPETRMNGICRTAVQGDNAEPQRIITLLHGTSREPNTQQRQVVLDMINSVPVLFEQDAQRP